VHILQVFGDVSVYFAAFGADFCHYFGIFACLVLVLADMGDCLTRCSPV